MIEDVSTPPPAEPAPLSPPAPAYPAAAAASPSAAGRSPWMLLAVAGLAVMCVISGGLAWSARERLHLLEQELVRRQDASQEQVTEARALAKQAQDSSRESAARVAVIESRVAESSLQRSQIEDLLQSVSRSRDENVLADTEAAIRVAVQQTAITGSAEPLVAALKQAEERLARVNEPRLERSRRAVARDLDRVRAAGVVDISALTIRLDEVTRMIDELPLLSSAQMPAAAQRVSADAPARPKAGAAASAAASARASAGVAAVVSSGASAASSPAATTSVDVAAWLRLVADTWSRAAAHVWEETRALVRVTRVESPEAALLAPEQAFFLRENLKLRLLNARLALLSRQFDLAQADMREAQAMLDRYFDRGSRRVVICGDLLRQATSQVRGVSVPKPEETLAALAAAAAGR